MHLDSIGRGSAAQRLMDYFPNPLIIPVGLLIGVLIAAPVGPVNVMCIQRAIERGFWGGVAAGIGSVLGDGLIALFAALGVGAVSGAFLTHRALIEVVGGIAFVAFGLKLFLTEPRVMISTEGPRPEATLGEFAWDIPQTFFLTITNPGAVLGLFAIFGGVSTFVEVTSTIDALLMVAAIMAGSLLWWIFLSNLIARYRHLIDAGRLHAINRLAGVLLAGFGAILLVEAAWKSGLFV
ncbi:MAG: LysE family translocator [Hyphomicrobium sp.]